jgi:histone H1/5
MTKMTGNTPAEREARETVKRMKTANTKAVAEAKKRFVAAEKAYKAAEKIEQAAWARIDKKSKGSSPAGTPEWQAASKKLDMASVAQLRASDALRAHEKEAVRIDIGTVYTELVERISRETLRKERMMSGLTKTNAENAASRKAAAKAKTTTTTTKKENTKMTAKAKNTTTIKLSDKENIAEMVKLFDSAIVKKDAESYRNYRRYRGAWLRSGEGRTIAQAQEIVRKAKGVKPVAAPKAPAKAAPAKKAAAPKAAAPKTAAAKKTAAKKPVAKTSTRKAAATS